MPSLTAPPSPSPSALHLTRSACRSVLLSLALLLPATAALAVGGLPAEVERLHRSGNTALALQRADEGLATEPGQPALRFLKAVMLGDSGRHAEAIALFEGLTQDYPELPEPYNNLAVLQAAAGRLDLARNLLDSALRHDPGYRTAHENLGDVLVQLAQRAYESAAQGGRGEPGLQRKLRLVRDLTTPAR